MIMCFTVLAVITLRNKLNLQKAKTKKKGVGLGWMDMNPHVSTVGEKKNLWFGFTTPLMSERPGDRNSCHALN